MNLEAEKPHPVVTQALDALKSLFGPNKDPLSVTLGGKSPQVLIHAASEVDSGSQGSTPGNSVKSSPPASLRASPQMSSHKFSSSDPTLNHIDGKGRNSRLRNEGIVSYCMLQHILHTGNNFKS